MKLTTVSLSSKVNGQFGGRACAYWGENDPNNRYELISFPTKPTTNLLDLEAMAMLLRHVSRSLTPRKLLILGYKREKGNQAPHYDRQSLRFERNEQIPTKMEDQRLSKSRRDQGKISDDHRRSRAPHGADRSSCLRRIEPQARNQRENGRSSRIC